MTALLGGVLSDWPAVNLRRPLPRTVRPVHDETVHSYLWRLAEANSMHPYYFIDYVKGSTKLKAPIPPNVVITLSGQPANSLRYAILELCTPQELAATNVAGRPRPGSSIEAAKCARCTHTRGIYDRVGCWIRSEDVICLHHRRWVTGSEQLDLTGHEDIILANRRHRRLIRRHGRTAASRAFKQASSIVEEWAERQNNRGYIDERMHRFHGREWRVLLDDPTLLASKYLPTVALTRLLASSYWKTLALHPTGNTTFVNEVRRTVAPRYIWDPHYYRNYREPLARTILNEHDEYGQEALVAELRRLQNRPEPPRTA